jgi:VCBS repeat-containing protein
LSTDEDTPLTGSLLAAAADIDSALLQGSIITGPQHGQVSVAADGSFTYTPDANCNGVDSFTYKVNDGELDSNVAIVNLTITPVNDAPVIARRTVTLDEDTQAILDLLAGASDVDGDALSVNITAAPQHGTLTQNTDGTWTYVPEANWSGADVVDYEVSDGTVSTATRLTFVINAVNDAPVLADQMLAGNEDTTISGNLLATATDVDSSNLGTAIVAGPQHGQLSVGVDGSFTYTPEANYNGADSFSYKVNDGELDSNVATVSLTVTPVNDAPVANPIAATLAEDGSITLDLLASAFDVDGDPLTVSVTNPQSGTLTHNPDGTWTYTPAPDFNGEDGFAYTVSDDRRESPWDGQLTASSFVRLTITAVNDAPVAVDDSAALDEDGSIRLALLANDHDVDGDPLSILIEGQPNHGVIVLNADNSVTYTPIKDWSGEDSFSYRISDGQAFSEIATVRLAVNPMADAPILVLTDRGGNSRELFRTGWESVRNRNTNSTLVEARELEGWTPVTRPERTRGGHHDGDDEHGEHDDHGGFEIWSDGDRMHNAQGRRQIVHVAQDDGRNWLELDDARGEGHQTLGIERSIDTVAGATYTLSLDYAGRIGYSAEYTRIGLYVDGRKIGGYADTSPATALDWKAIQFQFTGTGGKQIIKIVTEATRVGANGRGAMLDDITLTEALLANTGFEDGAIRLSAVSAALTDTDGSETLSVAIQALPVGATLTDGTRRFTATQGNTTAEVTGWNLGNLSLVPPRDFNGSIDLQVVASATESANGNQANTMANLTVTVLAVNDAPVANDASFTVEKGGSVRIDFSQLVSDVDGNVLTLSLAKPKHGTLKRNADGTYTYTPRRGYTGSDGFSYSYSVSDGSLTATGWIAINVLRDGGHCDHHHDNDSSHHNGIDHSEHKGYRGGDDDCGARIVVRSVDPKAAPVKIDWNGKPGKDFLSLPVNQPDWLAQSLGIPQADKRSLAEITGLVVRIGK